ncbi:MAG: tetratricopeptide repeat protein [Alphaproteobacteria bacterium]|nr:tetratricopeptide repeat protein [Alphaproteobacteria bacterium]
MSETTSEPGGGESRDAAIASKAAVPRPTLVRHAAAWLSRVLDPLGLLQLSTLIAFAIVTVTSILLLHHETEDYFTPLSSYLASIKLAIPPAAIFLGTYVIAFVTGVALADVPRTVISFARNRFFQSWRMMIATLVISSAFVVYCAWTLLRSTPPAYEKMANLLLGGSSDDLTIVRDKIASIRVADPEFAARLTKVVEVFAERNAVNAGKRTLSGERARILVRALEADSEGDWGRHPLRLHALAEAYSMFGQSAQQNAGFVTLPAMEGITSPFAKAIDLYKQVSTSTSPLATDALRMSALMNSGNAYYYKHDYGGALETWRTAISFSGHPNLSPWSNVIAALVLLDRPQEAIKEGEAARVWAEQSGKALIETYPYAGVLEATAFAKMQLGDSDGALADMATANALRDDALTQQNFALALIVSKRYEDAQEVLRKIAPPLDAQAIPDSKIARCVYLIWALATPNGSPSVRAANFAAFLGEHRSAQELSSTTSEGLRQLMRQVADTLPKSDYPCGSLGKIKAITSLLSAP